MNSEVQVDYLGSYPYYNKNGVVLDSSFNQSGAYLAVCNTNGEVYVYATTSEQTKKPFKTYKNHKAAALKVCWAHSKKLFILASCSLDRTVNIYNEEDVILVIDTKQVIPTCIMFAPLLDDIILAVGLSSGNLKLYDQKGNLNFDCVSHESAISCLEWNYQYDKTNIDLFKKNLPTLNFYPQKLVLATGSSDKMIKIWEITRVTPYTLKLLMILKTHIKQIRSLSWRPLIVQKQIYLTTASNDGIVKHWQLDLQNKNQRQLISKKLGKCIWKVGWDHFGTLLCISILKDENKNQTNIFQLKGNDLVQKSQLKENQE